MKTLYFECNMGAAGDMLLGALYELCDRKEDFLRDMNAAFASYGAKLTVEPSVKCGIRGTHMRVLVHGHEEAAGGPGVREHGSTEPADAHADGNDHVHTHEETHTHATYRSVLETLGDLALPDEVKKNARAIYEQIGNAEAKVHGQTLEQIHFHEIGTIDALVDVTGCAYLLYLIAPDEILSSPIHVGSGFVQCAHGVLPVPAPATAELLKGIPFYTGSVTGELCTPTGAAILKHFVSHFGPMPPLAASSIGYGMGTRDFSIANCVRAFFGEKADLSSDANRGTETDEDGFPFDDCVLSISCNLDDMTGEAIGLATDILLAAGALDVYTIPLQMKKNRPGVLLTCLCKPEERDKFTALFFLHTTTRGVRYQIFERAKLESTVETRHTSYGDIRVKKSSGYGIEKEKAEFEDLKSIVMKHHYSISLDDIRRHAARPASLPKQHET